jgi:hypothetical protein
LDAKLRGLVLGLCLVPCVWQGAGAEETPRVVVVTHDASGVQVDSSRSVKASTQPTLAAGGSTATLAMPRDQIGSLIRVAVEQIPPEQIGCAVEVAANGMDVGLLPRDPRALTGGQMLWLAQQCRITVEQLAPVAAGYLAGPGGAVPAPTPPAVAPTPQRFNAPVPQASRPATGSGLSVSQIALLGLSLAGSMAAGVGVGQLIGRSGSTGPRRRLAPTGRYAVSYPPSGRVTSHPAHARRAPLPPRPDRY